MKIISFCALLLISTTWAFSQDLIVKGDNDSINVKILKEDNINLYLRIINDGNVIQTFIPKEKVVAYNYGYYKKLDREELREYNTKIDFNAGIGYVIAPAPDGITDEQEEYLDELRSGISLDVNMNIFISKDVGLGFKYNQFTTHNAIEVNYVEDNVKVSFIGGTLIFGSMLPNNKGFIYSSFSLGALSEVNDAVLFGEDFKIEGKTLGVYLSTGMDIFVNKNVALGFKGGLMAGNIREVEINGHNVELEEPEALTRLDGMIGLKIFF